ncbi:MAG: 3'(2'),5'-bisphosphate nucleotidase CysQ [Cyclobacteriaceae bacterium]|nr:3'(2'),5'-bisphosphate nucleotidase CysQ [Cyclobacteriaceae bacterium]
MEAVLEIARKAGEKILEIYHNSDLANVVDYKADDSPLTLADKASNDVILEGLRQMNTPFPILSEESKHAPYEERKNWGTFWLVDPLDGTKEFINRNGEFTVNIALIENGTPVFGVIYVPVKDILYVGDENGAFKQEGSGEMKPIRVNNSTKGRIAVRSKSHASVEEEDVLKKYDVTDSISVGSSLKFCMVAEGKADVYYRHGPTMEWDTGAGQAIVLAAGGHVYQGISNNPFTYNKENLLNGSFLCLGF